MAATIREEMIRLGIIKPATPTSEVPLTTPLKVTPANKVAPSRQGSVTPQPAKATGTQQPKQKLQQPHQQQMRVPSRKFYDEVPGSTAWFQALDALAKSLCTMEEKDFREYLSSKSAENLFNTCEYIKRVMDGRTPPDCWLVRLIMNFGDLGRTVNLTDGALWDAYHAADTRHRAALAAWEAVRSPSGEITYTKLTNKYPHGSEGRRWIDAAWQNEAPQTRREAELRIAFAAWVAQRLRYKIGLKRAPIQPANSVWEAAGSSRRFGGGRPRSERFRR